MAKQIDIYLTPPTLEHNVKINHTNQLLLLDKQPYQGPLPLKDYGISPEQLQSLQDIPPPRENTYVLNLQQIALKGNEIHLTTNYTTMKSQFALRRWTPVLMEQEQERTKQKQSSDSRITLESHTLLQYILPLAGTMIIETADHQILMEERGKVEIPGKYHPAPAGGCETRNWQTLPDPFRCIKGEAWEETALLPDTDYTPPTIIGIVRDRFEGYNPVLTFHTKTHLELEQVIEQANTLAPEAGEHQRLFGIPADADKLIAFCLDNSPKIIGNGLGMLLLFGSHQFGTEWLDTSIQELAQKQIDINRYRNTFP